MDRAARLKSATPHLVTLGLFLVTGVLLAWPLYTDPANSMVRSVFGASHLYLFEWARDQLLANPGEVPLYTWDLGYPAGGYLVLIGWPSVFLSFVTRMFSGPVLSYNLIQLLQLVFGGWATFLLARHHGASIQSARVGGLVFGASPLVHSMLLIGEVPNLWHGLLPLSMLALYRAEHNRDWLAVLWGAAAMVLINVATPYYGIFSALVLAPYALTRLARARGHLVGTLVRYAIIAAIVAAAMIPVYNYYSVLHDVRQHWLILRPATATVSSASADYMLMQATVPSLFRPGKIVLDPVNMESIQISYLGLSAIAMSLAGLVLGWRRAWGWWVGLLLGVVLSLGDVLYWGLYPVTLSGGDVLTLPLHWLKQLIPFFQELHVPYRAGIITQLCLAMAVSTGLGGVTARWLAPGAAGLILLDAMFLSPVPWPLPVDQLVTPAIYEEMGADEEDYAVYPFPYECKPDQDRGRFGDHTRLMAIHKKRAPWLETYKSDRTWRILNSYQLADSTLDRALCGMLEPGSKVPEDPPDIAWFTEYGFRWLLLHTEYIHPDALPAYREWLDPTLGSPEIYGTVLAYPLGGETIEPFIFEIGNPIVWDPWSLPWSPPPRSPGPP